MLHVSLLLRIEQQRRIQEFAEKREWKIVRGYEEPEQSAKYEEIEERPVFAQLLNEVGKQFQIKEEKYCLKIG